MIHDPLCPGCVAADGLCDSNASTDALPEQETPCSASPSRQ